MKGYVYLDLDNNLIYKTWDYINGDNPGFFSQNKHLIIRTWTFDTEDSRLMLNMLRSFSDLQLEVESVKNFLGSIGFTKETMKELIKGSANNADKV